MARKKSSQRKSRKSAVRKTTVRKKKAKPLPMKKWLQAIKDSGMGGPDVEDTKDTTRQRRGGL